MSKTTVPATSSLPAPAAPPAASLLAHVFRVEEGLGNACLLGLPDGSCGFVDWGTQRREALEHALRLVGRSAVRFVAASHAHADHTLGLAGLLRECKARNIEVEKFVYPASTLNRATAHLTRARVAAEECGIPMLSVGDDTMLAPPGERQPPCLAWGDDRSWDIRVLSPALPRVGMAEMRAFHSSTVAGNDTSLVLLFRFVGKRGEEGVGRAVFPGDATPATLAEAAATANRFGMALDNQLMLLPHHGSGSNFPEWMDKHVHGIVAVSAPTGSPHHPSTDVLQRIAARDCGAERLFCTSYARCCHEAFGSTAPPHERQLVQPGPCFGNIVVRVPLSAQARVVASSHPGGLRRRYGYCGAPDGAR